VQGSPKLWLALAALAPLALGIGRLLPAEGAGLALRLAGASACVLVLPGTFVVRALGRPWSVGVSLAAALAWSLLAVFLAFAVTFGVGGTLGLTLGLLAGIALAALVLALRSAAPALERRDVVAALGLFAGGTALAAVLWWVTGTIGGSLGPTVSDALFHLARVRKLDEAGSLSSIGVVDDLSNAGVSPGYAFPLWHGALALIARLAGVDPTLVVLFLPAILTPLALLLAYGAGATLFGSWAGGAAAALGELALVVFPRDGVGWLQFLAQPGGAARLLLIPGLLALVFALTRNVDLALLGSVAAAAFVLAVVHPTYAVFVALPLAGFVLARALVRPEETRPLLYGFGALVVPASLFFLWLVQFVGNPAAQRHPVRFTAQVEEVGTSLHLRPEQMAWGGGVKVAALVAVPLAILAGRRRWSAYVLGGTLAVGVAALVPPVFDRLADAVSLSQAVRLASFLPLPFALAGAAVLAGRARLLGVAGALGVGIGFELAYGDFATGAAWAVWLATIGAAVGLVLWAFRSPQVDTGVPGGWAAVAAAAFTLPVAVSGFGHLERWDKPDPYGLTPGLTRALNRDVRPLDVVFAPGVTSYRIAGYAPVRIVVAPPGHVAFNTSEDYRVREQAARRFFFDTDATAQERAGIIRRLGVHWVVVDKTRGEPSLPSGLGLVYSDRRYALYRVA
jgi:hypothetical protein